MAAVEDNLRVGGYLFQSADGALVARGSTRADALQLGIDAFHGRQIWRLATVAAGTGVILPPAKEGMTQTIINSGANAAQIYGNGGDTINGTAGVTGVTLNAAAISRLVCPLDGLWFS